MQCCVLPQVLDDELCYKYSEYGNIYEVFATRARMFRNVYLHKCARQPLGTRVPATLRARGHAFVGVCSFVFMSTTQH